MARFLAFAALVASACRTSDLTFTVKAPSAVRVFYISGHNLHAWRHAPVELRASNGEVMVPFEEDFWSIEAHRTTEFYLVGPGRYRLVNHRGPVIKTLRRSEPRKLTSAHVSSELDPKTDSNDKHAVTSEIWRIDRSPPRPYWVLVTEHEEDVLSVAILDAGDRPIKHKDGHASRRVGGASWFGPFQNWTSLQISMPGMDVQRYSLRVAQADDAPHAERTAPVGTFVHGQLGPGHSTWSEAHGWSDIVTFTSDVDLTLHATIWWTPESEGLSAPAIEVVDEAGHGVAFEQVGAMTRDAGYAYTGTYATRQPHHGALRFRIEARDIENVTSGRYSICVASDPTSCQSKGPGERLLRSW